MSLESRGHLNPGDPAVVFERRDLGLDRLVRWVWIVRWSIPAGQARIQRTLTYPACNAVIGPEGAWLAGPGRVVSERELRADSWAVGVLLRPAATVLASSTRPVLLAGGGEPLPGAPVGEVAAAMAAQDVDAVLAVLRAWLSPWAQQVDARGLLVNEACRIAEEDDSLLRVADLAAALGVSTRTLTRLVRDRVGVTPKWLLDCRRLQQAATTLFARPDTDLAGLAAALGYADQAHFTRAYTRVIGETPDRTRRAGRTGAAAS